MSNFPRATVKKHYQLAVKVEESRKFGKRKPPDSRYRESTKSADSRHFDAFGPRVCGACGSDTSVDEHHLIPQVHGDGAGPTVYLCRKCHGETHGVDWNANVRELQRIGIAKAKADGKYKGRPVSTDGAAIRAALASGEKPAALARRLGIARSTVYEHANGEAVTAMLEGLS